LLALLAWLWATAVAVTAVSSPSISWSSSSLKSQTKPKAKATIAYPKLPDDTVVYRYGGTNPGNLTPRKTDTGLSFSLVPPPPGKGAAVTTIGALNATGLVQATRDGVTHVSVTPVGVSVQDWIDAGNSSIWTAAVKSVVVKWDGGMK